MVTKAELHQVIDELPDGAVEEAGRRLAPLRSPLARALFAAPEEAPEPDELAALAAIDRSEPSLSTAEVRRALGL